ncbi:MAG TPA: TolC family protein, partial [Vicinamibacteria bacterium]|nr:TolC family protein [Vicinamibacteria bacterium]
MLRPLSALLLALVAVPSLAQPPPSPVPEPAETEELPSDIEVRAAEEAATIGATPGAPTIGLQAAVARALEFNFSLMNSADAVTGAQIRESATRSLWYPRVTPSYLVNPDDKSILLNASQRLPWSGGSVNATATLRSSELTVPELSHTGDVRVVLTQPILKGFGPNAAYFDLRNSERSRVAQERSLELTRQRLAVQVTAAFYSVIA